MKYSKESDSVASLQAYTNDYRLLVTKLKSNKENWTKAKLKQEYLRNIQLAEGHPIMVIKTVCEADDKMSYRQCVDKIIYIYNQENSMNDEQQSVRYRRTNDHSRKYSNSDRVFPSVPYHLVESMRDGTGQQAVGILFQ